MADFLCRLFYTLSIFILIVMLITNIISTKISIELRILLREVYNFFTDNMIEICHQAEFKSS